MMQRTVCQNQNLFLPRFYFWAALFLFLFFQTAFLHADSVADLYSEVKQRSEQLHLSESDDLQILPRLLQAETAQKAGNETLAREYLNSCLFDLNLLETQNRLDKPASMGKQVRLEILFDLMRGYALTAILALLVIKAPWFRRNRKNHLLATQWGTAAMLAGTAFVFGWSDLQRYGASAWSYFDLQIVLAACAGLAGGFLPGLAVGLVLGLSRLLIQPEAINGFLALLISGLAGGIFFILSQRFKKLLLFALCTGLIAGLAHSLLVYFLLPHPLPWSYSIPASLFVTLSEAFCVLLFFGVMHSLVSDERREEVEQHSQLKFLQAQIKPHFLFNALNTISAVCSTEKAPRSRHLVGRLADFFRHALETEAPVLSLQKELEFVDAYLDFEQAHFGDDVEIVRHIQLSESARAIDIPILVIQPMVENALRHGLRRKKRKGHIILEGEETNQNVIIRIKDDGAGMPKDFFTRYLKDDSIKAEGHGVGVRNIDERLRRFFGKGEWIEFETAPDQGTCVTIRIPKNRLKTKD